MFSQQIPAANTAAEGQGDKRVSVLFAARTSKSDTRHRPLPSIHSAGVCWQLEHRLILRRDKATGETGEAAQQLLGVQQGSGLCVTGTSAAAPRNRPKAKHLSPVPGQLVTCAGPARHLCRASAPLPRQLCELPGQSTVQEG